MSTVRSLAVFMAMLITALLVTPSAAAQPPFRLATYVTDEAGVLSGSERIAVQSATGKLYSDRRIQLWVVLVDNFSGQSAVELGAEHASRQRLGRLRRAARRRHRRPFLRVFGTQQGADHQPKSGR